MLYINTRPTYRKYLHVIPSLYVVIRGLSHFISTESQSIPPHYPPSNSVFHLTQDIRAYNYDSLIYLMAAGQGLFWVRATQVPAETTPAELTALLPVCPSLQKIGLWPDRRSEGRQYALMAFTEQSEAELVISSLQQRSLGNGCLAVSHFNPFTEEREDATIHVKGLPPGTSVAMLRSTFEPLGYILSVQLGQTDSPQAPGFGFVQFENPEAATQAVTQGAALVQGREVRVEPYLPKRERRAVTLASVYVKGFGSDYTESALKSLFTRFGEVHSCSILRNQQRVFGFVNFYHQPAADRAVRELNGVVADGVTWVVSPQVDRRKAERKRHAQEEEWVRRNLFVGGLPPFITEDMLRRLFAEYGELESVKLQNRASYSFEEGAVLQQELSSAYVCYLRTEDAERALVAMQDLLIEGCKVHVSMWKPLEARKPAVLSPKLAPWLTPPAPVLPKHKSNKSKPKRAQKPAPNKVSFDLALYRTLPGDKRKALLGEFIYWQLHPIHKQLAGKLTGMILEIPEQELLELVQEPKALLTKAAEAVAIWKQHVARTSSDK